MTPAEIQEIIEKSSIWDEIGKGSFNRALVSTSPIEIGGLKCQWVRKIPIDTNKFSNSDRAVRKWKKLNPDIRAYKSLEGWILPYFGHIQAQDQKIADKLIDIYRKTRNIVLDAGIQFNFLEYNGEAQCVDVDYAFERGSPVSDEYDIHGVRRAKTIEFLNRMTSIGMVATASILRTLIYIETDLNREEIKDEYITPTIFLKLRILRHSRVKFTPKLMERLLVLLKLDLANEVIDSELNNFLKIPRPFFIFKAIQLGLTTLVERILYYNPHLIDSKDEYSQTPLMYALVNGHQRIVEFLLMQGANIFIEKVLPPSFVGDKSTQNWTALNYAINKNRIESITILVDAIFNRFVIGSTSSTKTTPYISKLIAQLTILHKAEKILNVDTIQKLLDLNKFDEANEIKIDQLLEFYNVWIITDRIPEQQVSFIILAEKYGLTSMLHKLSPLIFAAADGNRKMVTRLIAEGADIFIELRRPSPFLESRRSQNWTALNYAIEFEHPKVIIIIVNSILNIMINKGILIKKERVFIISQLRILHKADKTLNADTIANLLDLNKFDDANEIKDELLLEFFNVWRIKGYTVHAFHLAAKYSLNSMLKKLVVESSELIKIHFRVHYKDLLFVAESNGNFEGAKFLKAEYKKIAGACKSSDIIITRNQDNALTEPINISATSVRNSFFFPKLVYAYALGAIVLAGTGIPFR